jgi:hypothetical protein
MMGYGVHFIVTDRMLYADVVGGAASHDLYEGHYKFTARYPSLGATTELEVEEKRITYSELRCLYRLKDIPRFVSHVQFWEARAGHGRSFRPICAPWLDPRHQDVWEEYEPKGAGMFGSPAQEDAAARVIDRLCDETRPPPVRPNPVSVVFEGGRLRLAGPLQ